MWQYSCTEWLTNLERVPLLDVPPPPPPLLRWVAPWRGATLPFRYQILVRSSLVRSSSSRWSRLLRARTYCERRHPPHPGSVYDDVDRLRGPRCRRVSPQRWTSRHRRSPTWVVRRPGSSAYRHTAGSFPVLPTHASMDILQSNQCIYIYIYIYIYTVGHKKRSMSILSVTWPNVNSF